MRRIFKKVGLVNIIRIGARVCTSALLFSCYSASAQITLLDKTREAPILTLKEAIELTLDRNYQIKLVANDLRKASNNVTLGNAGMLPRISGDVSTAAGVQNTTQTLLSGETRSLRGAENRSLSYGVNLQWTVFDGFQMFTRHEQLKQLEALGEVHWKAEVLNRVYAVYTQYYDLVRQKQLIRARETALELSRFRLETAQNRFQIGRAAKLEVLNAQVDLNTDTTALLGLRDHFHNGQILLNELMGRDLDSPFDVEEEFHVVGDLHFDELWQSAQQLNPAVRAALLELNIARLESKRVQGQRYPVIDFSTAYTRTRSHSALGFSTESRGNGLNAGLSASINLFNGFNQRRMERNAQIDAESAQLRVEDVQRNVQSALMTAYRTYLTQLELTGLEQKNQELARQNLDITMEKFKIGSIAPVEFREAQRNFVEASIRYSSALLEYKLAETALKQIAGILVF